MDALIQIADPETKQVDLIWVIQQLGPLTEEPGF
jgi:hypothetical protein